MTFSFDGVNAWFTGGDWRIVHGTVRVKSLLPAVVVTGSVVLLVQQDQMTDELYKLIGGKDIVFGAPNMGTIEMTATGEAATPIQRFAVAHILTDDT
jgi:hypothetical protein